MSRCAAWSWGGCGGRRDYRSGDLPNAPAMRGSGYLARVLTQLVDRCNRKRIQIEICPASSGVGGGKHPDVRAYQKVGGGCVAIEDRSQRRNVGEAGRCRADIRPAAAEICG